MTIDIIDGNTAAAIAARLARVQCIPCFPITPQTEQVETFARWKAEGKLDAEFDQVESEHSVLSAAFGSILTGCRTYTASSSQGLLLMHELLPIIAGCRAPMVMVNVSRAISAPISLWCDHNDFLAMRDSGWIMIVSEENQEVLDSVIMAYKIAEKALLPVMITMDGFIHSYTRTEVDIPEQKMVDKFLPKPNYPVTLDVNNPKTLGIPAMGHDYLMFRATLHKAVLDSRKIIEEVQREWKKITGRSYDCVEKYKLKDADVALVIMGANTTICRAAVDQMRKKGLKVGLLRIRLFRPFPEDEIQDALAGIKKIAVIDQNISPGFGGILFSEIKKALQCGKQNVSSFIVGLGGDFISEKDFEKIVQQMRKSKEEVRQWLM